MARPTNPSQKPLRRVKCHKRVPESAYDVSWKLSDVIQGNWGQKPSSQVRHRDRNQANNLHTSIGRGESVELSEHRRRSCVVEPFSVICQHSMCIWCPMTTDFLTPRRMNASTKVANSSVKPNPQCSYPFNPGGNKSLYSSESVCCPSSVRLVPGLKATPHSALK